MLNYIRADLTRILTRKSFYIFFASLLSLYLIGLFITSSTLSEDKIVNQASNIFMFLSLLGGGYLFTAIYNDDLTAKSLPALLGFGIKRTTIIIAKIIIFIIMSSLIFLLAYITFNLIFMVLGFKIDGDMTNQILKLLLTYFLQLLAYTSIASIIVYGTQKATMSIVAFVLLATSFISQMLLLLLSQFKDMVDLTRFTLMPIIAELISKGNLVSILSYLIYIIVFITLSMIAFKKKDLEF